LPHPELLNLTDLKARLRGFAEERNWERFHTPKNLAMALAAEVGELVDIFQWLTAAESQDIVDDAEDLAHVGEDVPCHDS